LAIVAARSDWTAQETLRMMQATLSVLQTISTQSQQENERLLDLAQKAQDTAKQLKLLTQVATMYLPASLIAVRHRASGGSAKLTLSQTIFSSDLVTLSGPGADGQSTSHLKLFLSITIPSLFATYCLLLWVEGFGRRLIRIATRLLS
jgi:hypothetical protein